MKLKQKRTLLLCAFFTILFILNAVPAFAAEDAIPSIRINAVLQSDGSAVITEVWNVRGVHSGTEYYKALYNMDNMSVHSFTVKDESGTQYKTLENWNTKRSREEKAGTCGIQKTADGYELCWGIGEYGNHQYTIQYTLDGLVKDYGDYAGFYHQFVSELSSAPEAVTIRVRMADETLTENNARIWGYGFPGDVKIADNGTLTATTNEALDDSNRVNLLCRFDKALFPQAAKADMTFEDLQKNAEDEDSPLVFYLLIGIFVVLIGGGIAAFVFFYSRFKLTDGTTIRLPAREKIELTWSTPYGGSIPAVYTAMEMLHKWISCDKLMAAYLIHWQKAGYIRIEERENQQNKKKPEKEEVIIFHPEEIPSSDIEKALYAILSVGADEDGILWSTEMEKRAQKLYDKLTEWAKTVKSEGEKELIRLGAADKDKNGFLRFTASGFDQAVRMIGFQKYLIGMKLQQKDGLAPRELWGDYLVFAALFDIGEQVLNSMKALDPAYFETFSGMYGCNSYHMMYFMTMTNHISNTAVPNTNGTGGAAGSIGGGGFSGGGGGGSR